MAESSSAGDHPTLTGWPAPPGCPLYVPISRAAKIAGVSDETMRAWANASVDPVPHIRCGKKKLVRVSALPAYMERREVV